MPLDPMIALTLATIAITTTIAHKNMQERVLPTPVVFSAIKEDDRSASSDIHRDVAVIIAFRGCIAGAAVFASLGLAALVPVLPADPRHMLACFLVVAASVLPADFVEADILGRTSTGLRVTSAVVLSPIAAVVLHQTPA